MKKIGLLVILACLILVFSGCATTQDIQGLQSRVGSLENELKGEQEANERLRNNFKEMESVISNQQEVNKLLRQELENARKKIENLDVSGKAEFKMPDSKEVQTALKNAGFYHGDIDGVLGTEVKEGIQKFQEANGLKADGVVGSKTWLLLKKFLIEKTK